MPAQKPLDRLAVLFDRRITEKLQGFAPVEAVAHLNHLVQSGRANREEEAGVYRYARTNSL